MLECGSNYKGTLREKCVTCDVVDDEDHRLNHCITFRDSNFCDKDEKLPFKQIYSHDESVIRTMLS